ncbi:type II toxin-antitoxin system RelE/ParE family toxin [bacterium]|nr:type II toxin-antitoxin system RelE/ParE family toxin [bacterium]
MKIVYSPESVEDLQRLREFIAVKNEPVAGRIATALLAAINKLKTFPQKGTVVKAAKSQHIRDLFVDDYIVRYLISEKSIYILRIWHQKEDWK